MGAASPAQEVRFCATPHGRVAYASVGSGPVLLLPALWISHVELEWELPEYRAFQLALAGRGLRVVRYDRIGTGLSDRRGGPLDVEREVDVVEALVEELGGAPVALLGISWGGCVALALGARRPQLVDRIAVFGTYARGAAIAPAPLREALLATIRAHWGAGSRALADVWVPGAGASLRRRFAELQRASAEAEVAARALVEVYATDVTEAAARVPAPVVVIHRREDRAIPYSLGVELAALVPAARLVSLPGDLHPPWLGDRAAVVRAVHDHVLGVAEPPEAPAIAPHGVAEELSAREREVLRLVAEGLTNEQIAERLVLSPHTVHRHVANVRLKLGQPSRTAAATYAARAGII